MGFVILVAAVVVAVAGLIAGVVGQHDRTMVVLKRQLFMAGLFYL